MADKQRTEIRGFLQELKGPNLFICSFNISSLVKWQPIMKMGDWLGTITYAF